MTVNYGVRDRRMRCDQSRNTAFCGIKSRQATTRKINANDTVPDGRRSISFDNDSITYIMKGYIINYFIKKLITRTSYDFPSIVTLLYIDCISIF